MNEILFNIQLALQDYTLVMFIIMITATIAFFAGLVGNIIFYYAQKILFLDFKEKVDDLKEYIEIETRKH